MPARCIVQPTSEPLTVAEVRAHLHADLTGDSAADAQEDAWIAGAIKTARGMAETQTNRTIARCTWLLTLDTFPPEILLPWPRVISILDIEYTDSTGTFRTLDPGSYFVDNAGDYRNWAETMSGFDWPATYPYGINNVRVTYSAGYANAAEVPAEVKQWILMTVAALDEQRGATVSGSVREIARGFYDALLDKFRVPASYV